MLKSKLVDLAQVHPQFGRTMPSTHIRLEEAVAKEAKLRDPPVMPWSLYHLLSMQYRFFYYGEIPAIGTFMLHQRWPAAVASHAIFTQSRLINLFPFPSLRYLPFFAVLYLYLRWTIGLQDLVILKPQFLPDLMTTIITTKSTFVNNGILLHKVCALFLCLAS